MLNVSLVILRSGILNLEFRENINEEEFNAFTYNHEHGTFFQTKNWAEVKSEWESIFTGLYDDGQLVGVCLVLKRKVLLGYSIMYAPRGPVLDHRQKEYNDFYLKALKELTKKHRAISLTIDPYISRADYPMTEAMDGSLDVEYDDVVIENYKNNDFKHTGFVLDLRDSFQPRFTPFIDLSDESFKKTKGYREGVKAIKKDVNIERGGIELVERLTNMIHLTEEYKSINLRGEEYFKRLKDEFKDDCLITIASLDFNEQRDNLDFRLKDIRKRLDNPTLKEGRRNEYKIQESIILKDIDIVEGYLKEMNTVDIAALIAVKNGNKSELLYAGMNRDFQKYGGSYVNYVDSINWSHEEGLDLVSFGGNSGKFDHGIDKFKVLFNPTVREFVGEFKYINKKFLNFAFDKALEIKRK